MDCGVLVAPVAVTVMVVEYVPAASPVTIAVALNEAESAPESGESASQAAVVLTLQSNVPRFELETSTACPAGLLPPSVAVKVRSVGLRLIVGVNPRACPFPTFAMARSSPEFPSAHPVTRGRQRTSSPSASELRRPEVSLVPAVVFRGRTG